MEEYGGHILVFAALLLVWFLGFKIGYGKGSKRHPDATPKNNTKISNSNIEVSNVVNSSVNIKTNSGEINMN